MRLLPLLLVLVLPAAAQEGDVRPVRDKVHPHARRLLDERGPSKVWVFFTDKGLRDARELRVALQRAEADLGVRQRARREARRTAPGLVGLEDVPLAAGYLAAVEATGARVVVESSWLNAASVHGSLAQLERVAALPFVDRIEPVRRGQLVDAWEAGGPHVHGEQGVQGAATRLPSPSTFYGASHDQLDQIGLVPLHLAGYTGAGIVVGILDTGFHRGHEAFNQPGHVVNVLAEYDFVNDDGDTGIEAGDDASQHAHGTYILGCIAAWLPGELVGGAPDASFVLAKTEDITNEYQQEEDFYVAGLQFIEANGGDLATSSLGYIDWYTQADLDGLTAVTTIGVNMATQNGLVCLTAAGNAGNDSDPMTSTLIAPADALEVITVGAVETNGTIASFSSTGPTADGRVKPEVLACGVSTQTVCAFTDTDCQTAVNGTSLSTPLMAAATACLLQAQPTWSVTRIRRRVLESGDYFRANGTYDPLFVRGYGVPDLHRAVFGRPLALPVAKPLKPAVF